MPLTYGEHRRIALSDAQRTALLADIVSDDLTAVQIGKRIRLMQAENILAAYRADTGRDATNTAELERWIKRQED
jgi:hypothetical protein